MMLSKYGLKGDWDGFGQHHLFEGNIASGHLSFTPYSNTEYINEIDTLLTNGRLGVENKATLQA
eukprot:14841297-Ditylum_brightwellii.AAC.1